MNIVLDIENIVLEGGPMTHVQERALRASLESHLASLLSGPSTQLDRGYAVPLVRTPASRMPAHTDAEGTGRAIAHGVHSALAPTSD